MCAALTGALTLANPLPVYAQFSMDAISNMQIMQGQNILRQNIIDQAIKGSATKEKLGANSTVYVVSSERTKLNLKKFADQASSTGAEGSKHSLAILDRPDVIDLIGKSIEPLGLRVDDVSHTYALWWMRAWKAGHDKTDKFDRTTSLAVASQVAAALSNSEQFKTANDASKQAMAEIFLLQAAYTGASQTKAAKDPDARLRLANAVKQGAKAGGVDLDAVVLTPQGFKAVGK